MRQGSENVSDRQRVVVQDASRDKDAGRAIRVGRDAVELTRDLQSDNFVSGPNGSGWRLDRASGSIEVNDGTFRGELQAAGGTFTGNLSAAGGTFSGNLSAAGGTFSGDLSAAGGTFSGNLSAAGGTFSGDLSAAGGTFSGTLAASQITGILGPAQIPNLNADKITTGTLQGVTVQAADLTLDENGLRLTTGTGTNNAIRWRTPSGSTAMFINASSSSELFINRGSPGPSVNIVIMGEVNADGEVRGNSFEGRTGGGNAGDPIFKPDRNHPSSGMYNRSATGELRFSHNGTLCASIEENIRGGVVRSLGDLVTEGHATTTVPVNTVMTSTGRLLRQTSLSEGKREIEDVDPAYADRVLELRPRWYRSEHDDDPEDWSWWGLLAEEVEQIDPRLAAYCPDTGELMGVAYTALPVLLIDVVRRLADRVTELEENTA